MLQHTMRPSSSRKTVSALTSTEIRILKFKQSHSDNHGQLYQRENLRTMSLFIIAMQPRQCTLSYIDGGFMRRNLVVAITSV